MPDIETIRTWEGRTLLDRDGGRIGTIDAIYLDDRTGLLARIRVSREGSYFWRLAAITRSGVSSDWSGVRRFRMLSEPVRLVLRAFWRSLFSG